MAQQWQFEAELWVWDARRADTWTFVTVPEEITADIQDEAMSGGPPRGFGSVRVEVGVGSSIWRTSVFPDKASGCFVLPVKKAVRQAEDLEVGATVSVHLRVVT